VVWHLAGLVVGALIAGCAGGPPPVLEPPPSGGAARLTTFASNAELHAFLKTVPPPRARAQFFALSAPASSVTNVQHAGVDEGGIVKRHGDHLVVLRRGRLFTVRVGTAAPALVSVVDAFGPDVDPRSSWYDEILVSDDTVVVIGYSYDRGATELGLFDIDAGGGLRYRATLHLRSIDYFSARNSASRLLGRTLVLYAPVILAGVGEAPERSLPAFRVWRGGSSPPEFHPMYTAATIYRPLMASTDLILHTVVTCDLAPAEPTCRSMGVMGPPDRVFYVSPAAVYVWTVSEEPTGTAWPRALLYRLPLAGREPGALWVEGAPADQFSFLEAEGHLNVLVQAEGRGEAMWQSDRATGDVALLRVPLASFSSMVTAVSARHYQALPRPEAGLFQNRFVGGYVLYGSRSWGDVHTLAARSLYVYRYARAEAPMTIPLTHAVERIEPLGSDALVVGADRDDLHVSTIRLGQRPGVVARFTRAGAAQGETRGHGFFYRPEATGSGILGLPLRRAGSPQHASLTEGSASVLVLRNDHLRLRELGELEASAEPPADDGCRASCVDWYGNARPVFVDGRIYALLGYELVEGDIVGGRLRERSRVDFSPAAAGRPR
jgi:hypothetical protein